jgi:ribosomal protein S6--L-glutamate ligase
MGAERRRFVSLGSRLKGIPEVEVLGVKPNFLDYTSQERERILTADMVLFPTLNYAQFLTTSGRKIFPSLETYLYADEKIKQTTLFYMLGIPHPHTRVYYRRHHQDILKDFSFPFVAKVPRCSARGRGVYRIDGKEALEAYLESNQVAYIQEYVPHEQDLRVVLINYQPILAYWRIPCPGNFRSNLAQGGTIKFEDIPYEGVETAQQAARKCRLNDVGIDLIQLRGSWHVMEANMKYGRKGLKIKGLDLKQIIREKLLSGELVGRA